MLLASVLATHYSTAQELLVQKPNLGFNVGANFAVGTHFQRIGFTLNFYWTQGRFQTNSELRAYLNKRNLGPGSAYPELVVAQGLVVGYGGKADFGNPFLSSVGNQTGYLHSVAYSYNLWFNTVKTSQQTGVVAFQVGALSLLAENDILAHNYFDRFRTGAFLLQYQHRDVFQAGVSSVLWTGEMGRKTQAPPGFNTRCYMDTTGGRYTGFSHGLLSMQFKYHLGLGQNVQANLGVDAEQVRNVVQNKFIHDLPLLPAKWVKPVNCHIPMLDTKGQQYLFSPQQQVRPARVYWNVFSNANVFY